MTIAYAHGNSFMDGPSIWETLSRLELNEEYRFHVHVERFDLHTLPLTEEGLARWLEGRWIEKGAKLEALRLDLEAGIDWQQRDEKAY